jgi:hypothetical protein
MSSESEQLGVVEVGSSGDESSSLESSSSFDRFESEEIEGGVFEDGETVCGNFDTGDAPRKD